MIKYARICKNHQPTKKKKINYLMQNSMNKCQPRNAIKPKSVAKPKKEEA